VLTDYIVKLVQFPEALQVLEFADGQGEPRGRARVPGRAARRAPAAGHPQAHPGVDTRVAAIFRGDRPIVPEGGTVVEADDEVFCLAATQNIRQVMRELRRMDKPVRRVMIAGGGNIGLRLAEALERNYIVKIIEFNKRRCEVLSGLLSSALVLQGDVTDESLLESENVDEMDVFIAVTNDDENNIMSCLLAKRMGARRVIALINRRSYVDLLQAGQIDIAISPAQATIGTLLAHVRRGDVTRCTPCAAARPRRWRPWFTAMRPPAPWSAGRSRTSICPRARPSPRSCAARRSSWRTTIRSYRPRTM